MNELKKQVQEFQDRVFADRTLESQLLKLEEELLEYNQAGSKDRMCEELADVIIVCWGLEKFNSYIGEDILYRYDDCINYYNVGVEIKKKLEILKKRKWEKLPDGRYKHIKD